MHMTLFAFDGTWKGDKSGDDAVQNTNVVKFHDAYQRASGQPQFYAVGLGARTGDLAHYLEGAFGLGELVRLENAYDALCAAWSGGDHLIDIVGFSRGAATTLDFCRMIQNRGIRQPHSQTVVEPNPQIRFLGVWDVVDGFGLGCLGVADFNFGHCLTLPSANLQYAFHALALDERRPSFLPTRLRGAWEVWFRGVHSDVGGGDENPGLNDITLKWMMSKARAADLPIAQADIDALNPNPDTPPQLDKERGLLKIRTVSTTDRCHFSVKAVQGCENPASTCPIESDTNETTAVAIANTFDVLPLAVQDRISVLVQTPWRRRNSWSSH
jgi:uncharacterized protein (DUF2235 family)